MTGEFSESFHDDLQQRLLTVAATINGWVAGRETRGSHHDTTVRKLAPKIAALAHEFRDTTAYVQAPYMILTHDDGEEYSGPGEVTGEIVGFKYRSYTTLTESLEAGAEKEGVVCIMATGGSSHTGMTPAAWRHIFPPATQVSGVERVIEEYKSKEVVPVLIPLIEGTTLTQIPNTSPLHLSVTDILTPKTNKEGLYKYDYREGVRRVEGLMRGRAILRGLIDQPLESALFHEIDAMNKQYPYLARLVEVEASLIRTPSIVTPGGFSLMRGTVSGILRKFVYQPYMQKAEGGSRPRGAVQAVIYEPEVAQLVYGGLMTPEEADATPGTLFIPLNLPHTLTLAK